MGYSILPFLLLMLIYGNHVATADQNIEKIAEAINVFGINLYKELSKKDENMICSAFSVNTVMNMILAGAQTTSEKELHRTLGYETVGLSNSDVKTSYQQLLTQQRTKNSRYELDIANGIWIQQQFNVLSDFKQTIREIFFAEEQEVDFANPKTTDVINNWASAQTKGKIPKILDKKISPDNKLVLANAIYLKGSWVTKFNESLTKNQPFHNKNGNTKMIPMMNVVSRFPYTANSELNAQVIEFPYDGKDVSMFVFLPQKLDQLSSLEQQLTNDKVKQAIGSLRNLQVNVRFPKFKSSSTFKLVKPLQTIGIKKIFTGEADLVGINGKRDLIVSDVIQKAIIEVTEEGTVASAVTVAAIRRKSSRPRGHYFWANHPFLYYIIHKPTGVHLFTGRYVDA